jgi:lupus La protein
MAELTGLTENKPVPLATICSFKRMRRFKPYSAVVAALKESNELVVEGEEGAETLRRKKPFDPSKRIKIDERTVYVKGFGKEEPSTQFDIEAFFAQFGEFNSVRLRRGETGDAKGGFKGSVWVEWADQETADKFMALDPKPQWKEHDLLILWKQDYIKEKNEMLRDGDGELSKSQKGGNRGGRGNFRGRGNRRDGGDNWKDRRDRDQRNGHRDQRGRGRGRGGRGGRGRGGRDHGDRNSDANGKRSREDDGQEAPPAKKVDNKDGAAETA